MNRKNLIGFPNIKIISLLLIVNYSFFSCAIISGITQKRPIYDIENLGFDKSTYSKIALIPYVESFQSYGIRPGHHDVIYSLFSEVLERRKFIIIDKNIVASEISNKKYNLLAKVDPVHELMSFNIEGLQNNNLIKEIGSNLGAGAIIAIRVNKNEESIFGSGSIDLDVFIFDTKTTRIIWHAHANVPHATTYRNKRNVYQIISRKIFKDIK